MIQDKFPHTESPVEARARRVLLRLADLVLVDPSILAAGLVAPAALYDALMADRRDAVAQAERVAGQLLRSVDTPDRSRGLFLAGELLRRAAVLARMDNPDTKRP